MRQFCSFNVKFTTNCHSAEDCIATFGDTCPQYCDGMFRGDDIKLTTNCGGSVDWLATCGIFARNIAAHVYGGDTKLTSNCGGSVDWLATCGVFARNIAAHICGVTSSLLLIATVLRISWPRGVPARNIAAVCLW